MKRFGSSLLAVLTVSCSATGPAPSSTADSRLGTLMLQLDARDAHLDDSKRVVQFYFATHGVTPDGTTHLLAAHRNTRKFESGDWQEAQAHYVTADPNGAVKELPAPPLAWPVIGDALLTFSSDTQQPVLFFQGVLPGGRLFTAYQFNGSSWSRVDFLRSDRPIGDEDVSFSPNGQLRAIGGGQLLAQHGGFLSRWDGAKWQTVARPADAVDLRVGRMGKDGLRAWWVDAHGELFTDVLKVSDFTWRGPAKRSRRTGLSFGTYWTHSGTGDVHTLHVDAPNGQVLVLRYIEGGGFHQLTTRAPTPAEVSAKGSTIVASEHPYRGLELDPSTKELTASYLGAPTGSLGVIDASKATVKCPETNKCTKPDKSWAFEGSDCLRCIPRQVFLGRFVPLPDLSGISLLQVDTFDAVSRVFIKKVSLPVGDDFSWKPFTAATFPEDDGKTDDSMASDAQLQVHGSFLRVGAATHEGITVSMRGTDASNATAVSTVVTGPDGAVSFPAVPKGGWQITASVAGLTPYTRNFTATDTGDVDLGSVVLIAAGVRDAGFEPSFMSGSAQSYGGALIQWGQGTLNIVQPSGTFALSHQLSAGTAPLVGPRIAWNEGPCPGASCLLKTDDMLATIPAGTRAVDLRYPDAWAWPDGPIDGVTQRNWTRLMPAGQPAAYISAIDLEVVSIPTACFGGFVWGDYGSGVEPKRLMTCQATSSLGSVFSADPIPVLKQRSGAYVASTSGLTGYDADDCGETGAWRTGCKLYYLYGAGDATHQGSGAKLSDSGLYAAFAFSGSIFWVERATPTGPGVLAKRGAGIAGVRVDVATGLSLPTWAPGERPFYVNNPGDVVMREGTSLWRYPGGGGARVQLLANVVSARPYGTDMFQQSVVVHHRATPGTDCADHHCQITRIDMQTLAMTPVMGDGASGNEHLGSFVLTERVWAGCPGGPCSVVTQLNGATETPLAPGTIWPDRNHAWLPYSTGPFFLRNDGTAQRPSVY